MIDSIMMIAAGFAALVLAFFAFSSILSFFPALLVFCGELWMTFFRWALRMLGITAVFAFVILCGTVLARHGAI
jgi:hypothetical protein